MEYCTLKYYDEEGSLQSQSFVSFYVKGVDRPWKWQMVPAKTIEAIDGNKRTHWLGFRRFIGVKLAPIYEDEDFIEAFFQANRRIIEYQGNFLVLAKATGIVNEVEYENEWYDGCCFAKIYAFEFQDSKVWKTWPTPVKYDEDMYIKRHVQVEGTQNGPELFETNSGKLQYNYETTPFPSFDDETDLISVECNGAPYQDAKINLVGEPFTEGGVLKFYLAIADGGRPADDGNVYTDIVIKVQELA